MRLLKPFGRPLTLTGLAAAEYITQNEARRWSRGAAWTIACSLLYLGALTASIVLTKRAPLSLLEAFGFFVGGCMLGSGLASALGAQFMHRLAELRAELTGSADRNDPPGGQRPGPESLSSPT